MKILARIWANRYRCDAASWHEIKSKKIRSTLAPVLVRAEKDKAQAMSEVSIDSMFGDPITHGKT